MPNVVVYIRAHDWQQLLEQGHDPASYIRALVAERLQPNTQRTPTPPAPEAKQSVAPTRERPCPKAGFHHI
jgi:hypothetical protein